MKDLHTKPKLKLQKKKSLTCCHGFIFIQLNRCRTFKTLSERLMPPKFVNVMTIDKLNTHVWLILLLHHEHKWRNYDVSYSFPPCFSLGKNNFLYELNTTTWAGDFVTSTELVRLPTVTRIRQISILQCDRFRNKTLRF